MKRFTLIVFVLMCFGIAKAHFANKMTPGLRPHITIIPINNLADYNVTFRFIPKPYFVMKEISIQNKTAITVSKTAIEISSLEKDKKEFTLLK